MHFDESQFFDSTEFSRLNEDEERDLEDYIEEIKSGFYDSDSDDSFKSPGRNITKTSNESATKLVHERSLIKSVNECQYNVSEGPVRDSKIAGIMMILNQKNFTQEMQRKYGLGERHGSTVDTVRMRVAWESLGYLVYEYIDYRKDTIEATVTNMLEKKALLRCAISFGITFMSHGHENYQIAAFDELFDYTPLVSKINACQELKGKPKLVFVNGIFKVLIFFITLFQACRGEKYMRKVASVVPQTIPEASDVLFHFSTKETYKSFRSQTILNNGKKICSFFVYALTQEIARLSENDTIEIYQLLVRVNGKVAMFATKKPNKDGTIADGDFGQIPEIRSMNLRDEFMR